MTLSRMIVRGHFLPAVLAASLLAHASLAQPRQAPPLSPAQTALFDTPHLANVGHPETLLYDYRRTGPGAFTDTIAVHVNKINPDGSKNVAVDYLTAAHRVRFPALDHFHGNPLFMVVLEQDVATMNKAIGISKAYFRNRIREGFLDAPVTEATLTLAGKPVAARLVTVEPFRDVDRLRRIPSLQAKTYRFFLADSVPGAIAEIAVDTPADPALNAPAISEQITFAGVEK